MSRETLKERLEDSFCRWDKELLSGGSDPYYTDGQNMNLLRNHIISAKYDMKEAGEFPEIYHRKTPEELPEHFMVQAEKIYWTAVGIFRQCRDDVDYQYLCGLELSPKMENGLEIRNVLRNVRELEDAIKNQDFVIMRRHREIPDFKNHRQIIESSPEKIEPKMEQMSLFTMTDRERR